MFHQLGFCNINNQANRRDEKEIKNKVQKAIGDNSNKKQSLELSCLFHFAFCHVLDLNDHLVVHTHHRGAKKSKGTMSTQVFGKDLINQDLAHHKNCMALNFNSYPYQLLTTFFLVWQKEHS